MNAPPDADRLLDLVREKVAVLDADGTFRFLNAAVEDVLGFDADRLVGTDAFERVHPDDEAHVRSAFREVVDTGSFDEPLRYRFEHADGGWVWLESIIHPPADSGVDGYVVSTRDVTDAEESSRTLSEITRRSPDVLWMFDGDWSELLFTNDAVEDVYGIASSELAERPTAFLERVHPDDRPYVERAMGRLSAGESTELDYRVNPDEAYSRWVRVPAEPIVENGAVQRIVGVARDVTEEYKRNRQLVVMDTLLRHTIRNDLNVMLGSAQEIADWGESKQDRERDRTRSESPDYESVIDHAETIQRVGDELLTTAEKQRSVIDLLNHRGSPQPYWIGSLVADAVASARDAHPNANVTVEGDAGGRAFTVPGMETALTELLGNAVEHATDDPDVRVRVTDTDDAVEVAVRDNCPPIPAEEYLVVTDRRRMTDLYHTVGMGLWLVYWAVDRSDGDLSFDTHPDGNVVTVSLPAVGDDDEPLDVDPVSEDPPTRL
ncbi:hypothetical protein JCM17823_09940 [Halorubrum gandharaense]